MLYTAKYMASTQYAGIGGYKYGERVCVRMCMDHGRCACVYILLK